MNTVLRFGNGFEESSDSFVIVYKNQFGITCFAYQNPGELVGFLADEVQEEWSEGNDEWPNGVEAGAYFESGRSGPN